MNRLRAAARALDSLTGRGRAFLGAAAGCALAAVLLGEGDLLRAAALLAVLPLAGLLALSRTRYRLRCARSVHPVRQLPGASATVTLRLDNVGRLPTSALLVQDTVPFALGRRPGFALARLPAGESRSIAYTVRSEQRGRFRLGPLTVRLRDPFGCCEVTRSFTSSVDLVVSPPVVTLPAAPFPGGWTGLGEDGGRAGASTGEDDATVRDYRQGDDLRRVHWGSTARAGALMVRREAVPWSAQATVLLDDRASAHRGVGPASSFERAVSACASIVEHLCRRGIAVRLRTVCGVVSMPGEPALARLMMLDLLADVAVQPVGATAGRLTTALPALAADSRHASLVAVLGALDPAEARLLAGLPRGPGPHRALLLDCAAWSGLRPAHRTAADASLTSGRNLLEAAGWRAVIAGPGDPLADLWLALCRPQPAAAVRW